MKCRICGHDASELAQAWVMKKYNVSYFMCNYCGFVQTEEPYWLGEAYAKPITDSDIGLVQRNVYSVAITKAIICKFFNTDESFVDYGGGYGLFVRMMRDKGFAFHLYDKFCENIFAKGFEIDSVAEKKFELLTAFEVFEHVVYPLEEIEKMLRFSDNIFFSTNILPKDRPMPGEWWYYGLEHGQHVSLYSYRSLKFIAQKFNLNLYSNRINFHILTKKHLSPFFFRAVIQYPIHNLIDLFVRRTSLLYSDYKSITDRDLDYTRS